MKEPQGPGESFSWQHSSAECCEGRLLFPTLTATIQTPWCGTVSRMVSRMISSSDAFPPTCVSMCVSSLPQLRYFWSATTPRQTLSRAVFSSASRLRLPRARSSSLSRIWRCRALSGCAVKWFCAMRVGRRELVSNTPWRRINDVPFSPRCQSQGKRMEGHGAGETTKIRPRPQWVEPSLRGTLRYTSRQHSGSDKTHPSVI